MMNPNDVNAPRAEAIMPAIVPVEFAQHSRQLVTEKFVIPTVIIGIDGGKACVFPAIDAINFFSEEMLADFFVVQIAAAEYPVVLPPEIDKLLGIVHEVAAIRISNHQCPEPVVGLRLFLRIQGNLPLFKDRLTYHISITKVVVMVDDVLESSMGSRLLARFNFTEFVTF